MWTFTWQNSDFLVQLRGVWEQIYIKAKGHSLKWLYIPVYTYALIETSRSQSASGFLCTQWLYFHLPISEIKHENMIRRLSIWTSHFVCDRNCLITSKASPRPIMLLAPLEQSTLWRQKVPDPVTHNNSCSLLGWVLNRACSIPPAPAFASDVNVERPPCVVHLLQAYTKHRETLQADIHNIWAQSNYLLANACGRHLGLTLTRLSVNMPRSKTSVSLWGAGCPGRGRTEIPCAAPCRGLTRTGAELSSEPPLFSFSIWLKNVNRLPLESLSCRLFPLQ